MIPTETKMTKSDVIELQQPLDYADGASGDSEAAKEDISYHHGNENDQADMARLGKKQKLKVRWKDAMTFDFTRLTNLCSATLARSLSSVLPASSWRHGRPCSCKPDLTEHEAVAILTATSTAAMGMMNGGRSVIPRTTLR